MPEPEGGAVVPPFWNWKKVPPPENKGGVDAQTLTDIARGMQHAVNSTVDQCQQHYARSIERCFNDDGTAITKRIILPHDAGEMEVPIVALMPPTGLALTEVEIEMSVRIDSTAVKSSTPADEENASHTRTSFAVSLSPRATDRATASKNDGTSAIDIKMHFKAGDPPEGISRIIEAFANTMVPHEIGKLPPEPGTGDGSALPAPPSDEDAPDLDKPASESPDDSETGSF